MIFFDSSTLILLAKAELLALFLSGAKQEVVIPGEVDRECCRVKKTFDALMITKAVDESKIKVMQVKDKRLVAKLQVDFSLGQGEAEAIALALKARERVLGIDDKNAINACKLLGIPFTTAMAILVRSREKGLLDRSEALTRLAMLAGYSRYKSSIVEDARLRLEAGP
jgi:predicted nucleic acid-binding protein